MERNLVLHAEKNSLDCKFVRFCCQYGTYFSFACGEDWPGWQGFQFLVAI
jgi:hypothetical protein